MDEFNLELKKQLLKKIIEIQKDMLSKNSELEKLFKELEELDKDE